MIGGKIYALYIEPELIKKLEEKAEKLKIITSKSCCVISFLIALDYVIQALIL